MDLRERERERVVRAGGCVCVRAASLSAHTKQRKLQGRLSQGEFISLTSSPASAPLHDIIYQPSITPSSARLHLLFSPSNLCLNINAVGPLSFFTQNPLTLLFPCVVPLS